MSKPVSIKPGDRFNMLTVKEILPSRIMRSGGKKAMALVICDCGTEKVCQVGNLKSGVSSNCGCIRKVGLRERNRIPPQIWITDGEDAYIFIGEKKVLISKGDTPLVSKYRWYVDKDNFVKSGAVIYEGYSSIHRLLAGLIKENNLTVDHINHNRLDNRRSNIRAATPSENSCNIRKRSNSKALYKGVYSVEGSGKYYAQITVRGKCHRLGSFKNPEDAAIAYNFAAIELHGEFASLNVARAVE